MLKYINISRVVKNGISDVNILNINVLDSILEISRFSYD